MSRDGIQYQSVSVLEQNTCENELGPINEDNFCIASNCDCRGNSGSILALPEDRFQQIGIAQASY